MKKSHNYHRIFGGIKFSQNATLKYEPAKCQTCGATYSGRTCGDCYGKLCACGCGRVCYKHQAVKMLSGGRVAHLDCVGSEKNGS